MNQKTNLSAKELQEKSDEIRKKVIEYHKNTKIPHLGCDLSAVEIMTTLYYSVMKPGNKFILSKGHSSGLLYTILNDRGLIPDDTYLKLEEHPTLNPAYGIEATTGSLGHGLSIGLGMALADRTKSVYVLMGDGECDEGQVWEAVRTASELKVKNLVGIVDCNGIQGFKQTDHSQLDARFAAFGCQTARCDGHDCRRLLDALSIPTTNSPLIVLANTVKGKGVPGIENQVKSHYVYQG